MSVLAAAALGAGISALGGLAASSLTNSANANLDNANRQWQERMWHTANAYNAPVEQRKRLQAAGINPALAFQNGNTGVAASSPTPNQHTPADFSALGSGMSNAANNILAGQRLNVESENINADTEIKKQQAMFTFSEGMQRIQKMLAEENLTNSQRYLLDWQLSSMKEMFPLVQANQYAQLEQTLANTQLTNQMRLAKAFEMELANKRYFLDKQLNEAQIAAIAQQISESIARIRQTDYSLSLNAKAVANDVIHTMNQDAAAFENIGISREMIDSNKFRNYVGSAVGAITGVVGAVSGFGLKSLWNLRKPAFSGLGVPNPYSPGTPSY